MRWALLLPAALLASPALASGPPAIWFAPNGASLRPYDHVILDNAVTWLRTIGAQEVCIAASTDRTGSQIYNLRLSRQRGELVRRELIRRGFPAAGITVRAYGEGGGLVETPDGVADGSNRYAMVFAGANGCPSDYPRELNG